MRQVIAVESPTAAISRDERELFVALGSRSGRLPREANITQQGR